MPSIEDRMSSFSVGMPGIEDRMSSFSEGMPSIEDRMPSFSRRMPSIDAEDFFDTTEAKLFLGFSVILVVIFIILVILRCCGVLKGAPYTRQVTPIKTKTEAAKDKNPYKPLENPPIPSHTAYLVPNNTFPAQQPSYACFPAGSAQPVITYPAMVAQPVTAFPVNILPGHPPYPIDPKPAQVTMPTAPPCQ